MIDLSQQEADLLIAIEKLLTNPKSVKLHKPGEKKKYSIISTNKKENFTLSFFRGRKNPTRGSYTLLYQNDTILLRVDSGHGMHMNPNGDIIPANTPHIHIYREGYSTSFAFQLPASFQNSTDLIQTLYDFLRYSKVINVDEVQINYQGGLFYDDELKGLGN